MLFLLAAAGAVTVGEICAAVVLVGGAVKLVLETAECAQRLRKAMREEKKP